MCQQEDSHRKYLSMDVTIDIDLHLKYLYLWMKLEIVVSFPSVIG